MKVLPENFIIDKDTNWIEICKNYKLSEEFIEKYIDKLDLCWICLVQKLSEKFIEKHFNKLNREALNYVSEIQVLSEEFIEKYFDKLKYLVFNNNISRKTKRKFNIKYIKFKSKRLFFRKKFLMI